MSIRKSGSGIEGLRSSGYEERTPLRSLDNDILHLSSATKLKNGASLNAESTKSPNDDIPDGESKLHLRSCSPTTTMEATTDRSESQSVSELGDVTFKSYICVGGEVEILNSMLCEEESLVLPKDCVSYKNEKEDSAITHSVMMSSCCEHEEHPYCNPEGNEPCSVITNVGDECCVVSDVQARVDLFEPNSSTLQTSENFIWEFVHCDGGEVEIYDNLIEEEDNQFPPLESELSKSLNTSGVNSTCSDCSVNSSQVEHADHPYCTSVSDGSAVTENTHSSETTENGLNKMLKLFTCTGGEVEISDSPKLVEACVLLPEQHRSINPSISLGGYLQEQFDHPQCYNQTSSMPQDDISSTTSEIFPSSVDTAGAKLVIMEEPDNKFNQTDDSLSCPVSNEKLLPLRLEQVMVSQPKIESESVSTALGQTQEGYKHHKGSAEKADMPDLEKVSLCRSLNTQDDNHHMQETTILPQDGGGPSVVHKTEIIESDLAPVQSPTPVELQNYVENISQVKSIYRPSDSSETKDSALGSSGTGPAVVNSVENLPLVLKVPSNYTSVFSALQMGILSPVVRRASLCSLKDHNIHPAHRQFLADDSALDGEKSELSPVVVDSAGGLLAEVLESPMPRPLLNSTAVGCKPQAGPMIELGEELAERATIAPQAEVQKQVLDFPLMPEGPLQQQLMQMAEFLILASGKMGPAATAIAPHSAAVSHPEFKAAAAESHTASVGTSPVKQVNRSLNTSGLYERKRLFSVVDSCTMTDPLLWNLPSGSLEGHSRPELEQRLISSMIMVEALVQQLTAARAQACPSAGRSPSELREKLVQTEHTELSQTTMYRDLYLEALSRIDELELNESFLQNLMQCVQDTRITMTSLSGDTDAALSTMKEVHVIVQEDHQSLVSHYEYMKSLFEKSKRTQLRMTQKVKEALQQRSDMETQMQEAVTAKEAAFNVMEQLRTHCAIEMSASEKSAESQQELLVALKQTYPQQVSLNKSYTETLSSASELLSQTADEQSSLKQELFAVQSLVQRCVPILLKLNEKAADALRERDEHMSEKDQAIEEREQIEEKLNEAHSNLQSCRDQIGDLNLQVTILTSEMGVLRQKLMEKEDETSLLERKAMELSATVSSTLASYTFLEQALAGETTNLQQSWKDVKEAKERANELEASLDQSEQHRKQLSRALAQSEEQLEQLQTLTESQSLQIQQLQDVCTQLSSIRETNEFLLMENELAREQVRESEQMLGENLQSLRERNIQCEDLKREVSQLRVENKSLQDELETTQYQSNTARLQHEETMAHVVTDITLLFHTLHGMNNELHSDLSDPVTKQTIEQKDKESQPGNNIEQQRSSSSFVDNVMLALTAEREEDVRTDSTVESDKVASPCEALFSRSGAFTRLGVLSPKKSVESEVEDQSRVVELLSGLSSTVTELVHTLKLVQQHKDGQLMELQKTICEQQVEHQASNRRHEAKTCELEHQLSRLQNLVERGNYALEQKTQDEKILTKLISDVQESQEALNKHKTESNELRKELSELRRALHQSKRESQFLLEELKKAEDPLASPAHYLEEKIHLLKEVERLKACLQEVEQARVKLLERAKRHQIIHQTNQQKTEKELLMLNKMIRKIRETLLSVPEVVNSCKQLQQLIEYIG
ncbi:sperm-associated antigen 5 [Gouania willdenowi]|uniref:sperm-associated antigen 5 n=1 Tax=Gouania willdenowi TaxID=441366 RepID=UPI001055D593|nr:sperm-associated antigen 5 [Gouania willdenowi]XP_028314068.1 sperm-associated antigen 5 [Gouania willdenowi]XP_028314078.1 sperm-associated antigen 5 [Gouania willdenowi]XP_028314087.1 sperm-associated antigen 5 [Gouania willdenowi]